MSHIGDCLVCWQSKWPRDMQITDCKRLQRVVQRHTIPNTPVADQGSTRQYLGSCQASYCTEMTDEDHHLGESQNWDAQGYSQGTLVLCLELCDGFVELPGKPIIFDMRWLQVR